ncbi:MAG: FCD domain-containing protein [Gammaproteobacteria bacterium]|nr:FCD domain-containing protein [Gammaproteobacteria bacterium]
MALTPGSFASPHPGLAPRLEKRERLADRLYGQIVERIVSGALEAGDKLPSENELCRAYGVSRPVIRETLMRLQADGLIHTRQGVGSFIERRPPPGLIRFAEPSDLAGVMRCFEVRLSIEGAAARLAAQRGAPQSVAQIESALSAFKAAMDGEGGAEHADFEFHLAVAKAANNDYFVTILSSLHTAIDALLRISLGITTRGSAQRMRRVYEEHESIYDAIAGRDGEGADLAMRYHLNRAQRRITDKVRDR